MGESITYGGGVRATEPHRDVTEKTTEIHLNTLINVL